MTENISIQQNKEPLGAKPENKKRNTPEYKFEHDLSKGN